MNEILAKLVADNLLQGILTLLIIAVLVIILLYLVNKTADTIDKRIIATTADPDRRARLKTLSRASKNTLKIIILGVAVLIGLATIGVDIGPALAAAGILGLAVSLGAQTLIKDMFGGLTILLEDQYRVGDTVRIGAVIGEVERITLRRTDVRDAEGRLFIVPNGEVRVVANETRGWARALVELNFSFDTNLDRPMAVLEVALAKFAEDASIKPLLLAPPEIFGWNSLKDWAVVVRLSAKVMAGKQGETARILRKYAFEALHEAGVPVESSTSKFILSEMVKPGDMPRA